MSDDSSNWWGRNAVLAAAVAGLLGLVGTVSVAIITTSRSGGGGSSNTPSPSPHAGSGSSLRSTVDSSPSPSPSRTGQSAAVAWRSNRIRLPYGMGLDLDAAAPTLTDNGEFVVSIGDTPAFPVILLSQPAGSLGTGPASDRACAAAINTNSISGAYPTHPGDTFCEQSAGGAHLAAVTITSWDPQGNSGYGVAEVAVVVWQVG
jgi:hypothetical protein